MNTTVGNVAGPKFRLAWSVGLWFCLMIFWPAGPAEAATWLYRQDPASTTFGQISTAGDRPVPGLPGIRRLSDRRLAVGLSPTERATLQPNYSYRALLMPNDPQYPLQWNLDLIGMPAAWDADQITPSYGGDPGVLVAVIDTGVGFENYQSFTAAPDFAGTAFWTNPNEIAGDGLDNDGNGLVDDLHGWDFVNDDAHANDDNGHGTHVTAIIAETTDNGLAVAGIAWQSTILPLKVLDGSGSGTTDVFAAAIAYAADQGTDIINLSLGGQEPDPILEATILDVVSRGVVVVAATGNDGVGELDYPARYDGVISVGAVQFDRTRTSYSNYGPELDLMAPGGNLAVDQNNDGQFDGIAQQTCTSPACTAYDTMFYTGTSQATAHVSAVAALLAACGAASGTVQDTLQSTATDLGPAGRDDEYGYGLIQAAAALSAAGCAGTPPAPPSEISGQASASATRIIHTGQAYPYSQPVFTWSGPPGATYQVGWTRTGQTTTPATQTSATYSPKLTAEGVYLLQVNTVDALGRTSAVQKFTYRYRRPVIAVSVGGAIRLYRPGASLIRSLAGGFGQVAVNAAAGNLELDGTNRLAAFGRDGSRSLKVMDTRGRVLRSLTPFGQDFGGVLDAIVLDSLDEPRLVVGTATGGAALRWYRPNGQLLAKLQLYRTYQGGVRLASGDLDGDGHDELIVAQVSGPEIRVYDRARVRLAVFKPLGPAYQGGWRITSGDWEGDGREEIIIIPSAGSANIPVYVTTLKGAVKKTWRLKIANNTQPVDIETLDVDGNGKDELLALPAGARLTVYQWSLGGLSPKTIKLSASLVDGRLSSLR